MTSVKIKGFWHIYLINHWYSIVTDQIRIILTSGLYDSCEEINIGCLGIESEKKILQRFFVDLYPKLKIKFYSENNNLFEFPTLKLIESDKTNYVGFYFHTKGVTRPFESIINHWRSWLNEGVLNRWECHLRKIKEGYETSGVNYLPSYKHYSGNFFWFNREYINKLPKIDKLDKKNRWAAEQWICMASPKLFNLEFKEPGDAIFLMENV